MSMVTQYKDEYWDARQRTRWEEFNIDRESEFERWRIKSGPPKFNKSRRILFGVTTLPIAVLWAMLFAGCMYAYYVNIWIYKFGGYCLKKVGYSHPNPISVTPKDSGVVSNIFARSSLVQKGV